MKSIVKQLLKPCPFCGKAVKEQPGFHQGIIIMFFKCSNPKCGAIISFDNDKCNIFPLEAREYFNRRENVDGGTAKCRVKVKVKLESDAYMPEYAHDNDAGLDIRSPQNAVIWPHNSTLIDTGVHIAIPAGMVGMLKSKSGLNVKHGLLNTGVIDSGYTGSIMANLYNHTDHKYFVKKGDKISQLVIMPVFHADLRRSDELAVVR